jgi:hypothetical protein
MTAGEIRGTIAAMRMDRKLKEVLLHRALNGEREALFAVAAKRKQQQKAAEKTAGH